MGSPAATQSESRVGTWDDDEIDSALHHLGKVDAALDEKVAAYGGGEKHMLVGKLRGGRLSLQPSASAFILTNLSAPLSVTAWSMATGIFSRTPLDLDDHIMASTNEVAVLGTTRWSGDAVRVFKVACIFPPASWNLLR